jgi:thioredoxin 1
MFETDVSDPIQTITETSFRSRVLDGSGPIAVEFMSYGCGHCRTIEPVLQQVAAKMKDTEHIFRVNVGLDQALADEYAIRETPTFVMFLDGGEVSRVVGPHPTLSGITSAVTRGFQG